MLSLFIAPELAMQMPAGSSTRGSVVPASSNCGLCLRGALLVILCAASAGCATTSSGNDHDTQRLAEVSAVAGKPGTSFRYSSLVSYEPIGESDVLVFTSPREAWLLHLYGPCRDLEFGSFVGLTSTFGRVAVGYDKVLVRDNTIPCQIQEIRPVDTAVLRRADHERKLQAQPSSGQPPSS
jgi:hypothetical protein